MTETASHPDPDELWEQAGGGTPGYDHERYRNLFRKHWLPAESGFPDPADANWELLREFDGKPHPLVNNDWQPPDVEDPGWLIEMFHEMRAVHHLLDLIGVPLRYSIDTDDIDCRVLVAVRGYLTLRERLARISGWHARETGPAGTVGDYCTECGNRWSREAMGPHWANTQNPVSTLFFSLEPDELPVPAALNGAEK